MSPSCTSVLRDPLEQIANAAGVAEVEVQVVDDDQEDAAGRVVARPRRRQDDAFLRRRRRRGLQVVDASAVHERQRRNVLLDAVLEDFEIVLREVGDELILRCSGRWHPSSRNRRRSRKSGCRAGAGCVAGAAGGGGGCWSRRPLGRQPDTRRQSQGEPQPETSPLVLHIDSIRRSAGRNGRPFRVPGCRVPGCRSAVVPRCRRAKVLAPGT